MSHTISNLSIQVKNPNRVNISIDGKYRLSLDVYQVTELGIHNGMDVTPEQIAQWEEESAFGKLYGRALEYTMIRPHSAKEVKNYLFRKTLTKRVKKPISNARDSKPVTGNLNYEVVEKIGVSREIADRVYRRLLERGYINDEQFVRWWLENRHARKGASKRRLIAELRGKGVEQGIIESLLPSSARNDEDELQKIIANKSSKYPDTHKLIQYLMRQGFRYDDIRVALLNDNTSE